MWTGLDQHGATEDGGDTRVGRDATRVRASGPAHGWTTNQRLAIEVALALLGGRRRPVDLDDSEWWLLLLAAGINNHCAKPGVAARRVLGAASRHAGYFERAGNWR
ncbi:MAG TPA: hypothetical protein VEA69_04630 [Tepidisphaeraceae bacterium]|nr:hypothetical protein [Tepidisphaeraceae bacterium]